MIKLLKKPQNFEISLILRKNSIPHYKYVRHMQLHQKQKKNVFYVYYANTDVTIFNSIAFTIRNTKLKLQSVSIHIAQ